jgi:hypothetical protein
LTGRPHCRIVRSNSSGAKLRWLVEQNSTPPGATNGAATFTKSG